MKNAKKEVFNPDHLDCCIEIGDCELQNPPKELIDKLIGQPISDCKKIIKEFLKPKEKLVVKFQRKIGFKTQNDNR
tara:strand:+ start:497 stop:724 length:228 start_codon:yes stop_codon:yes gene_type:complete